MTDAGFYRGTSSEQDSRFADKQRKYLKQMRFEGALDTKVDISKVNLDVIKPWITKRINEILGMEDDVVIEYVFSQLEEKNLNPKVMQINLTGFLNARRAREFFGELWQLLIDAQDTDDGIPPSLVKLKMQQIQTERNVEPRNYRRQTDEREQTGQVGGRSDGGGGGDWRNRYESLSQGRFSGPATVDSSPPSLSTSKRDTTPPRRRAFDEQRGRERQRIRDRRSSPSRRRFTEDKTSVSEPKRRRFTEENVHRRRPTTPPPSPTVVPKPSPLVENAIRSSNGTTKNDKHVKKEIDSNESDDYKKKKKRKRKSKISDDSESYSEGEEKKKKKHKHKKHRKHKKRPKHSDDDSESDMRKTSSLRKKALSSV